MAAATSIRTRVERLEAGLNARNQVIVYSMPHDIPEDAHRTWRAKHFASAPPGTLFVALKRFGVSSETDPEILHGGRVPEEHEDWLELMRTLDREDFDVVEATINDSHAIEPK